MKTLILFYSYSGNTREIANKKAIELNADIEEIFDVKRPNWFNGSWYAMKRCKTPIKPLNSNLNDYDTIILMSPIWASSPMSALNSVIDMLPSGKEIQVMMVTGGGNSKDSKDKTIEFIKEKGCEVVSYVDISAKRKNKVLQIEVLG